jgi:ketosteroid isomerase-like protein
VTAESTEPGKVTQEDVETVRTGYERWNNGDLSGLGELFTEDIVYQNAPAWPGQRVYHGVEAVTSFLRDEVARIIALRPVTVVGTEVIGDEILIELQARTRGTISGLEMDNLTLFHLAKMENGRVSRVRVYLTAAEALKAAETGEG